MLNKSNKSQPIIIETWFMGNIYSYASIAGDRVSKLEVFWDNINFISSITFLYVCLAVIKHVSVCDILI